MDSAFLEDRTNEKIQQYQLLLNDIRVYDKLRTFGVLGEFTRTFFQELEWLKDTWLDDESEELFDAKRVAYIEDRLIELPFETALAYADSTHPSTQAEWRRDPSIVMTMSREDKEWIYKQFEYMCYFVLNTRETLLYDILKVLDMENE